MKKRVRVEETFCSNRAMELAILDAVLRMAMSSRAADRAARALVDQFGSLSGVTNATPLQWSLVPGLTAKAVRTLALMKAAVQAAVRNTRESRPIFSSVAEVERYVCSRLSLIDGADLHLLFLDDKLSYLYEDTVSLQDPTDVQVIVARTIRGAIEGGATNIVVAPSSKQRVEERIDGFDALLGGLERAGQHLGIRLRKLRLSDEGTAEIRNIAR